MRIERWYWLIVFCFVSFMLHLGLVWKSRTFAAIPPFQKPTEIEVALQPLEEKKEPPAPKKAPEKPKPAPEPLLKPEKKHDAQPPAARKLAMMPAPVVAVRPVPESPKATVQPKAEAEKQPTAPNAEPGGIEKLKNETPITAGLPTGKKDAGEPKLQRMARLDPNPGGGGAPAPGIIPGGHGGAPGPEAPPEDILFNGGGAGGMNLPRAAPRIGGGGGKSILSVENPLAKEAVPEEKPGLGPGLGAGEGIGNGGGVGYGRGQGIGTRLDGKEALATLHAKPGVGIGAGVGKGIGTKPPGGGHGTGAELPGTGGTGLGYGRGSGIGVGEGSGTGVGNGNGSRSGRMRGVPFGDVAGLLRGDPNGGGGKGGGPGGTGRGAVFGSRPLSGGGDGPIHIVYVVDTSLSMQEKGKILKAKAALKTALSELKPKDSFDIINFDTRTHVLSEELLPATPENIQLGMDYVDNMRLRPNTNISGGLELALSLNKATHIYLMSDGKPEGPFGLHNFDEILQFVHELNTRKVKISTLALGLGENFEGMELLKSIAKENSGDYAYVNLAKEP
jgi:hypothetical protein